MAFQGVPWCYSHLAARRHLAELGLEGTFAGHRSFVEAARAVERGEADLAFLPIENTTSGSIPQVHELLCAGELKIVAEATWKVDHCLAATARVPLASLRRALSHPQGLEQCAAFLRRLPDLRPVSYFDTAEAMAEVARAGDATQAAIGPPEAADAYGLTILERGIADQEQNYTRFLAVAREPIRGRIPPPSKTSLVFHTRHERGALVRALAALADEGLQLTKLESRPRIGRPWEYMFFVDFEGDVADANVARALLGLERATLHLKVLGSYPARATAAGDA